LAARNAPSAKSSAKSRDEARAGLLFLSPTLVIVLVLVVIPALWTLMLAFQRMRLIGLRRTGLFGQYTLGNFETVLTAPGFWRALAITLIFTIAGTALSIVLGLAAALLVRAQFPGRTLVRGAMLLPWVAPVVAMAFTVQVMLDPQLGVVNALGQDWLGWDRPIPFLAEERGELSIFGWTLGIPTALLTVILFEGWRYFPFAFLFLLARLQAVPGELEEAARVDGATPLQRFRHVVLPQLAATIALLSVLRFIMTFNKFDDVYLLTGGAAGTDVVSVRVYNLLTARDDIGGSAAQAMVLAAVLVVLLGIYFRYFAPRVEGTGGR
jgi:multiple sugar transport system permease protein